MCPSHLFIVSSESPNVQSRNREREDGGVSVGIIYDQ